MKILTLDIEMSPNLADVWTLWQANVSLAQLRDSARMLCFAATWHGEKSIQFYSEWQHGRAEMVAAAHKLVSEADVLVGYNSKGFDYRHLQREFLLAGLAPTPPAVHVDLYQVVRKEFKFPSNKLDYVAQQLGLGAKLSHAGHELWVKVLNGDAKAQATMQKYNVQDVRLTEQLYDKLLPWIRNHPNHNLHGEQRVEGCPNCGGVRLQRRGVQRTRISVFHRFHCQDCGAWSRSGTRDTGADIR